MASNKSYTIKLGVGYDAEILGKLETEKNKSAYMKDLIRKDIAGELVGVTKFTDETEQIAKQYSSIVEEKYKEQFNNNMEKSVNFITNTIKDTDIIEKLSAEENKSDYIRRLILMNIGLINQDGKRFLLLDENGNAKNAKRTISERRKEREKGYSQGEEARFNKYEYDKNYRKEHYKKATIELSLNDNEILESHIVKMKETKSAFIKRAIKETIERDNQRM